MDALERIEAKLDLIMQELHVEIPTQKTMDANPVQKRKYTRYDDEINNISMAAYLNVGYIGNKEFCRIAETAGLQVIRHGHSHPYIKKAGRDLWIKVWKGEE